MTNPDLAAMSAAATQGECATCAKLTANMEHTAARLAAQMSGKMVCRECAREYRAGRLVQIDPEGMRERVARAMCAATGKDPDKLNPAPRGAIGMVPLWTLWATQADVAIAAMMGGVK